MADSLAGRADVPDLEALSRAEIRGALPDFGLKTAIAPCVLHAEAHARARWRRSQGGRPQQGKRQAERNEAWDDRCLNERGVPGLGGREDFTSDRSRDRNRKAPLGIAVGSISLRQPLDLAALLVDNARLMGRRIPVIEVPQADRLGSFRAPVAAAHDGYVRRGSWARGGLVRTPCWLLPASRPNTGFRVA
jgi:hypothetical protein